MTLVQRFTVVSLTSAVILSVVFGELAARIATEFALRRQAHAFAVYVSEFAAPRLVPADFFQPPPAIRAQFEFTLRSLIGRAHIQHVSVWNRRGEILYSDDPQLVGTVQVLSPSVTDALAGQLRWQLLPGSRGARSVGRMEVFVPVVVAGDGRPVGVYHVVADIPDLEPTLVRLSRTVRASVVGGILLLYLATFTVVRQASRDLDRQQRALRAAFIGIVRSLAHAVDARDMPTAHHSSRVAEYAEAIAREMGLDEDAVGVVQVAGLLHDVGKIGIRDELLSKRSSLTPQEWEIMRRHPVLGYEILEPVPIAEEIKLAVRHSHERWDGTGYPDGLSGERIPIAARIIAVADAYEALVTDRPYRRAQSPLQAVEELRRGAGRAFDPGVVDAFLRVLRRRAARGTVPVLLGRTTTPLRPPTGDGQRPGAPARQTTRPRRRRAIARPRQPDGLSEDRGPGCPQQ
jgi:putative nucleotidyltransferase with HDIG domain